MSDVAPDGAGSSPTSKSAASLHSPVTVSSRAGLSVVTKLTLLVGITLALLLAVLLAAGWFYWRQATRTQVESQLTAVAASRRDTVRAQLAILTERVRLNTDRGEFRGYFFELSNHQETVQNRDGSQASLQRIADGQPVVEASLVDQTGQVVLSTDAALVGQNIVAEREFQQGLSGPHVGEPRRAGDHFESVLAAPIRSRGGQSRVYGVLYLKADVSALASAVGDVTGLGQTGEAILGVRAGDQIKFLFPPRNAAAGVTSVGVDVSPALRDALHGANAFSRNVDYRGIPVLAAGRPIGYQDWAVVVKMDEKEADAPIATALRLEILAGLGVALLGLGAAYALALSFTRPVRRLAQAAGRVTGGDFSVSLPSESADEFGELSLRFNQMAKSLRARRDERELSETALREADRRKDEFLAMLSHELRNPLSAIANAIQLARQVPNDSTAAGLAHEAIARQTGNLKRLVDDLLDVSRISEGRIELRRCPIEAGPAIRRVIETVQPLLTERRHTLDLALVTGSRRQIDADPVRLEQIVTNLLINAIKYTPDGGQISLSERHEDGEVVITVSDNGIGIAPDLLPKVFDLFIQADSSLNRDEGGLGIGLHLCRHLVTLHGGKIFAQSPGLGRGATFTVRLPALPGFEPAAVLDATPRPAAIGRPRRILLVDDNRDSVRSLSRLLALRGHQVATAFDGIEALEAAEQFHPEVFLLDIGLPGLDGYALAERLRAEGFPDALMVAISGYAQEKDRARAREAGFNHHFAKPVDFDALAELLAADAPAESAVVHSYEL